MNRNKYTEINQRNEYYTKILAGGGCVVFPLLILGFLFCVAMFLAGLQAP